MNNPRTKRKKFWYHACNAWVLVDREATDNDKVFLRHADAVAEREAQSHLVDARWQIVPVRMVPR